MVILGCAGELVFVIFEYLDDRRVWYKARTRGFITFPERPPLIVLILELLSVAFVVVGIAGELNVDFRSGRLETQRNDANGKLILLLDQKAGAAEVSAERASRASDDAVGKARQAKETSTLADSEADSAKESAKGAVDAAATAKASAVAAGIEADEAKTKIAKANKELFQLQEALGARSAGTNGEQNDELLLFAGTPIALTYVGDPETGRLMSNIRGLLIRAKWNIIRDRSETQDAGSMIDSYVLGGGGKVSNRFPQGTLVYAGIQIYTKPDGIMRPSSEAARMLSYILKDNHIGVETFLPPHWLEGLPDDAVWMVVGRKPQGFLEPWDDKAKQAFVQYEEKQATLSEDDKRDRAQIVARHKTAPNPN
jgi:hypothetical protein